MNAKSIASLLTCTLLGLASSGFADQTLSVETDLPSKANIKIDSSDCENSKGPWITLEGAISLGGINVDIILRNNKKGTHETVVQAVKQVVLLPLGNSITIPKQPSRGGVGGNPFIWLQLLGTNDTPLTDEIFLGRCVQGLSIDPDILIDAIAKTSIAIEGCTNKRGPFITLSGVLTLKGVKARLIFRNNINGPHEAEATVDIGVIPDGHTITIPKQPVLGGVGGNPLISVQFRDSKGAPIGEEVFLGRCNQL